MKEITLTKKEIYESYARLTFYGNAINENDYKIQFQFNKEIRNYNIVYWNQNKEFHLLIKKLNNFSQELINRNEGSKLSITTSSFDTSYIDKLKKIERNQNSILLLIASDTGITHILSLIRQKWYETFLSSTKIFWFYEDNFFLPDYIQKEYPIVNRVDFHYYPIDYDEYNRMEFSRQIIEKEVLNYYKPDYVLIIGDGKINHALKGTLIVNDISENQIETIAYYNPNPLKRIPPEDGKLRTGFTTGACAAASAKAATKVLLEKKLIKEIKTVLPNRMEVIFSLKRCELYEDKAICSVIKDAGDDPDCTHLAEIVAEVKLINEKKVILKGGKGVAIVTKPGLGLEVGGPAINPVPRKNITENVLEILKNTPYGAEVTISVPRGREMALDTTNARLGLIGGISILGTTGIVKPYSTAAYRASIVQAIQVAKERGISTLVFTTGGRSEQYAMDYLKSQNIELPIEAYIQVGDFIGTGIKHAKKIGIPHIIIFGMIGKLSKMADGVTQTHQAGSSVNMMQLANYAKEKGASENIIEEIKKANTARHVLDICKKNNIPIADLICKDVVKVMLNYAYNKKRDEIKNEYPEEWLKEFKIDCYMTDFDGKLLGYYKNS
ncbi:MAG: hypothetical protein KatS3mg129_3226 [Leptospiraceae bacterium]|nr:MAG: hypothetical protein KatS3mg129_3226 [Leptospiraceae bacterium]